MTGPLDKNPDEANLVDSPSEASSTYSAADLRNARRKARRLGLDPKNGIDAINMLETRGIAIDDGEVSIIDAASPPAVANPEATALATTTDTLPATQSASAVPAVLSRQERQVEIDKLQAKMTARRNQRLFQMIRRFFIFVLLPTFGVSYYLYKVATPLYSSNSILSIENATETTAAGAGLSGLFRGTALGGQSEPIKVQNYMESRNIFTQLEKDFKFPEVFMGENIDRFTRVDQNSNEEKRYKVFKRYVISRYDTTDQVLRLEVRAPDPETTLKVSNLIINYAETALGDESKKLRIDALESATKALNKSESDLKQAQSALLEIQRTQKSISPTGETEAVAGIIAKKKVELNEAQIALDTMMQNAAPNPIRVKSLKTLIADLEKNISRLNDSALSNNADGTSLSEISQDILIAEADVKAKLQAHQTQIQIFQATQTKSLEKRKYLTQGIPPAASFEPIYPKKLPSSLVAFVIFFGLYLFISMTIDVIREQVSV